MSEPTRFRRAWAAWLDSAGDDDDDDGATTRELGDALAELLTDTLIARAPAVDEGNESTCFRCGRPWSEHDGVPGRRRCGP